MSPEQISCLGLALVNFASFIWAILRFFKSSGGELPGRMKVIKHAGTVAMLINLAMLAAPGQVDGAAAWLGFALYVLSLALFWAAVRTNRRKPLTIAFTEHTPEHLVAEGPYRFVRHPFYSSYTLTWIAGAVATKCLWLLLPAAVMVLLYYQAARLEESQFERSSLAQAYEAYRSRTGMFFPFF